MDFITILTHYTTYSEFNQTGLNSYFTYTSEVVPIFPALVLAIIFFVTLFGTYSAQRSVGRQDFISSFAVAGFVQGVVAILMTAVEGFINIYILGISIVFAIVCFFVLFSQTNER